NSCFAIPVTVIHVRNMRYEFGDSSERFVREIEFRRSHQRYSQRIFSAGFFSATHEHCRQVLRHDFIGFPFEMDSAMLHPDRAVRETSNALEVVRNEENRDALMLELLDASDTSLL